MLERKRKQLIKSIVLKTLVIIALCALNAIVVANSIVKVSEKNIYNAVAFEYPNLLFDKELSKIAEECAERCYSEGIEAKDVRILENETFIKQYSSDCYVTKYTVLADSDEDFIDTFSSAMQTEKYMETNDKLKKCQFVGIGKYKMQVFILAFYKD